MTRFLFFVAGLSFLLLAAVPLQAQSAAAEWQTVPFGDETETPVINQIVVDGTALWVGTPDGLWRFDGRSAERWDTGESNHILSLLLDKDDRLWIGTTLGLILLNADRDWAERIEPFPQLHEPIWAMEPALDGSVWLGSDSGLYNVSLTGDAAASAASPVPAALPGETVQTLAQTASGDLWIGTRDSGLFLLQQVEDGRPQITEIAPEMRPRINALLVGQEGRLWAGTEEDGLCLLPGDASGAICSPPPFDEIEQPTITGLFPDSATLGAFWIATPDRLWHYAPPANLAAADLRSTDVRTIVEDGEGQLWAGATSGLLRRRPLAWQPLLADLDRDKQDVRTILEDSQGLLWAGTNGGLLQQAPGGPWQAVAALESQAIYCLAVSALDNSLWACLDNGVAQIDSTAAGDAPTVTFFLDGETVNDIWQDTAGSIWFATTDGVWQKTGSDLTHHPALGDLAAGPANPIVNALAGDGQGGFWAGTLGGLSHFDGFNWQPPACPSPGDEINDLAWDSARGQLWLATTAGLAVCAGETYSLQPVAGELVDDYVRSLALESDLAGTEEPTFLLAGTYEGLSRIDIRDPRLPRLPVTSYNRDTHLPDNRVQALAVLENGRLLLGTPYGLYAYQPSAQAPQLSFSYKDPQAPDSFASLHRPGESLTIGYDDDAPLHVIGHDLRTQADDLIYRFEIRSGEALSQTWSATGDLALSEDLLAAGENMTVSAWAYDRDFNQAAHPAVLQITRQSEPLALREEVWALSLLLTIALVTLIWWTIGRLQFVPYENLELTLSPAANRPDLQQVQISGGRRFRKIPAAERPRNIDQITAQLDQIPNLDQITDIDQKLDLLQEIGGKLYDSLFSEETAVLLRDKLGLGEKPVRLRLIIDPALPGADALPWELLYGGSDLQFLTIDSDVALVRDYPDASAAPKKVKNELKTLLLISTPLDLPLDENTIDKEIAALRSFAAENLDIIRHASQEDLQDITAGGYDLIHFLGHGDQEDGQSILYFEDNGDLHPIKQDVLVEHFSQARPTLIFLNACRSARSQYIDIPLDASRQGSNSLAEALVSEGNIPAVVGMGYEFDSEAANEFSRAFYQKLLQLGQVDDAVSNGREVLSNRNTTNRLASVASRDWFTPRLYMGLKGSAIYKQSLLRQHRLVQAVRDRFAGSSENHEG